MLSVATNERCAADRSMRMSVANHARKTYVERRADTAHTARACCAHANQLIVLLKEWKGPTCRHRFFDTDSIDR